MNYKNTIVLAHPLVKQNLAIIRDKDTSRERFLSAFKKLSYFLLMAAYEKLPTKKRNISTPLENVDVDVIDEEYTYIIVPILRAGLALTDMAVELLPEAHVLHIGMYRDEEKRTPVWYYDKTPENFPKKTKIFILDPMLATGGSAVATIDLFVSKGVRQEDIVFVSVLAAPEGIEVLYKAFPDVQIITLAVDKCLNDKAYIIPGLGDAGDRYFNSIIP